MFGTGSLRDTSGKTGWRMSREESAEGTPQNDHTGDDCGICNDPIEEDWVLTFEGPAHPECDEQRTKEAMEVLEP